MEKFYQFFSDTFPQLFGFVGKAIPALSDAAEIVKYVVLIASLALAAFAVVAMVIGCFKIRFFRRLARVLLIIETLGMIGLVLIAVNTTNTGDFPANLVAALKAGSPAVFDLIKSVFADFGEKTIPSFIIILVAFVVISLLLHLIIVLSRIIIKRANAKADADADAPEELPEEETVETTPAPAPAAAPAEAVASVPVEEPIVPADVPEQELETVTDADAAPDVTEEPAAEEPVAEEPVVEEAEAEAETETAEENEPAAAPIPDYPKLEKPVFMPIPSDVADTTDFTDAKRDGFTPKPGVSSAEAEKLLSDEAAEDLTAVVYGKIGDRVAELPIDALNENFKPYSYINAKILRQKGLIPESATEVRITSYGKVDKPLMVQASAFGPGVVKMIVLAGGRPIHLQ
ncbi:MAG: hypothetical protein IKP55_04515 [Clostridia bacterium]|nr:hypothetical protein [Clostridia bacterium]